MSPISATSVPLREGLFGETDAGPTLMASHCAQCDHTAFPRVDRCTNCRADDQETVEFGGEGKLLCATVVYMGNGRFSPGYSVGYVTMPPGLRVFGQLAFSGTEPPMPRRCGSRSPRCGAKASTTYSPTASCRRRKGIHTIREVFVIGVGQSDFGKTPDRSISEIGGPAARAAIADAGIDSSDLQAVFSSRVYDAMITSQTIMKELGVTRIEMVNVENACAGGSTAIRSLYKDIAAGFVDVGIAIGVESMTTSPIAGKLIPPDKDDLDGQLGLSMPVLFALQAQRLMATHGATREDFAQLSVKAHDAGALNPRAQYRKRITVDEVLASRMIADPITLLQCCPNTDGAAAVVMASAEVAKKYTEVPVRVAGSSLVSGDYDFRRADLTTLELGARAAAQAYEQAGVSPADVDVVELHDAFASEEIVHYEDLGLCARGDGVGLLRSGATSLGGRVPVNPSGGLLSLGHPLAASGVRVICDITDQLRGRSGASQVPGAKVGLAQMLGGVATGLDAGAASVHVLTV